MPNTRELELWRLVNNAFQNSIDKFGDIFAKDVTRDLLANGVTVQEWISVKDRLPDKDGNYLVFQKDTYGTCMRTLQFAKNARKVDKYDFDRDWKNVWYRYHSEWGYITIDSVTHWMPLPQPPMGNKQDHQLDECSPQTEEGE